MVVARIERLMRVEERRRPVLVVEVPHARGHRLDVAHEVAAVNNRTFRPPAQRSGPRPAGPKTRCFNCNLLGHFSRDCRKPRKNRSRNSNPNNGPRPNVHAVSADHISRANNYNGNPGHLATPMMVDAEPFTVSLAQGN